MLTKEMKVQMYPKEYFLDFFKRFFSYDENYIRRFVTEIESTVLVTSLG